MKNVIAFFALAMAAGNVAAGELPMNRFNGVYDLVNTSGSVQAPDELCWPRKNKRCADETKFRSDTIANICPGTVIVDVATPPGQDNMMISVFFGDPKQGFLPHAMFANSNDRFNSTDSRHRETSASNWVSSYDITGGVKNFRSLKIDRNDLQYTTLHRDVHIKDAFYTDWSLDCKYSKRPSE